MVTGFICSAPMIKRVANGSAYWTMSAIAFNGNYTLPFRVRGDADETLTLKTDTIVLAAVPIQSCPQWQTCTCDFTCNGTSALYFVYAGKGYLYFIDFMLVYD